MAEEMQRLYKKNKINPFASIIVMIVQFPVFICVWGALSGSSALTSGSILGLNLSMGIKDVLFVASNWGPAGNYAAVTALFLFLLMAGAQTVSMLLPQWLQKAKAKKVAKLGKNPAAQQQNNRMKWFTYIMLAMIIFMGFSLVSAMGVYWFVGALISIAQTLIMQAINARKEKKKK
jgi:YidC/Oxa1 family membrane protein insertase